MTQKRFFIGAVEPRKNRGRVNGFVLCMVDLQKGRFFYPENIHVLASAVKELCSYQDLDYEQACEAEKMICVGKAREYHLPLVEDGVDDISSIDDAVAEFGTEEAVSGDYEGLMHMAVEGLLSRRVEPCFSIEPEEGIDAAQEEGFTSKEDSEERPNRVIMAMMPKDVWERRQNEREQHPWYRNPMFDYDRDFTFLLEDVPKSIRDKERLLSIKTVSDQYRAVSSEIDRTLHPEPAKVFRGFNDSGSPDLDTFMEELSGIESVLPNNR